ncbi:histone H1.1 isoform X3 [Mustela putorius furo]|uniref:Histone H1.1 isoform X3 n=1 Tax=Mustela putorius furo TaxID=9669 RepID=A0A8U0V510_MUSPF|nr:histone H1.1 isoform X3 [Mustela putorius furo]
MVPGWAVIHTFSSTRPQLEAVGLTAEPCGIWDNSVLSGLLWTWAPLRSAPGVTTETECLATTSANAARQLMSLGMMVTSFGVDGAEENAYKFSTAVHLAVCPGPVAISSHRALSLSTWGILTTEETVKEAGKVSSFPCAEDEGAFVSSHSLPHSHRVRCFLKDRSRIC